MYNTGDLQGFTPSMLQADYTNYLGVAFFALQMAIIVFVIGVAIFQKDGQQRD